MNKIIRWAASGTGALRRYDLSQSTVRSGSPTFLRLIFRSAGIGLDSDRYNPLLQASRFPNTPPNPSAPQSSMFLHRNRLGRALSAFDHASHRWAAIPLCDPHDPITQRPSSSRPADTHAVGKQMLSLISWNIQASRSKPVARSELILDHIFEEPKFPDIILLQEVASSVRESLLSDSRVRSSFLTTDAVDDTSFKGVPFATMTLLSSKRFVSPLLAKEEECEDEGEGGSKIVLDSVFRMELPSRYQRDALCVNIAAPPRLAQYYVSSTSTSTPSTRSSGVRFRCTYWLASCASPDAAAASSQATSTQSTQTIIHSSTITSWWMLGSHCTGARRGLMEELHGVSASNSRTDLNQADWTRSSCWACSPTRSKSSSLVSSMPIRPGATTAGCAAPSPCNTVSHACSTLYNHLLFPTRR